MKRWICYLGVFLFFICLGIIFLTPSLTGSCTNSLLMCLEDATSLGFWSKLWHTLVCVGRNVACVLGGLFI